MRRGAGRLPLHVLGVGHGCDEALGDGHGEVVESAGRVVEEEGVRARARAHVLHHVEVLRHDHQVEHLLGVGVIDVRAPCIDALPQPLHDGLPLASNADAAEVHRLGLRLGLDLGTRRLRLRLLDRAHLDRLTSVHGRLAQPLGLVNLVHGILHVGVGLNVGDRRREDLVAEATETLAQVLGDGPRNLLLREEDVVELDLGHGGAHDVVHVRLDLLARVRKAVVRRVDLIVLLDNLELDRDLHLGEHVVLGLGLA